MPVVVPATSSVLAYEGEVATELTCALSGNPRPKLSWFYKGEKVVDNLFYRLPDNGSLFIIVMRPQLAGNYSCMAENVMGSSSQTIILNYGGIYTEWDCSASKLWIIMTPIVMLHKNCVVILLHFL